MHPSQHVVVDRMKEEEGKAAGEKKDPILQQTKQKKLRGEGKRKEQEIFRELILLSKPATSEARERTKARGQ